jgi:flagellar protein FliS
MQYQANADSYLTTEVFTAPPQKLQLMLLDAAIRQIARTKQQWRDGEEGKASLSLIHAQQIVEQLIAGVNREAAPELADRALGVYSFLARRLMEAGANRDESKLDDATRVLEIDRETWRRVCEELSGKSADQSNFISSADKSVAPLPTFDSFGDIPSSGLSLEA